MYRLSSKDLSDILNLINFCRSYLKNRGKIKDILSELLKLFRSNDAVFFSGNRDLNGIDWVNSFSLHGDRLYLAQYANYYWRYDPLYQTQFCPMPIKPVFKTDDIISYSKMAKLEYYNDFLRPQNQLGELIVRLCSGKKFFGVIALQRSKEQPHFDNRDIQKARILVPHLINTFETTNWLSKIDEERKLLEQWLESQSEGIILLDSELRPLYYNSRAKRVCLFLSGMTMEALHNAESVDISIPSVIIKDCMSLVRPFEGDSLPGNHRIINTEHGKRYYLKYSLISSLLQEKFVSCFVVFLKNLTRPSNGAEEVLSGKCRLSRREEAIAQYAGIGLTNKEIAEKLSISPFTVQNHLKSIFKKTGVKNRTQLANLVQ
jgi:DNA-binding CsgD family transcriptional regulator